MRAVAGGLPVCAMGWDWTRRGGARRVCVRARVMEIRQIGRETTVDSTNHSAKMCNVDLVR